MELINKNKELLRVILSVSLITVGILHIAVPQPLVKIMPSQLPYPLDLVYLSRFYEILGGIGLLAPPLFQAIRLPLQGVLIAWAYWYTKPDNKQKQASIIPKSMILKELEQSTVSSY